MASFVMIGLLSSFTFAASASEFTLADGLVCKYCQTAFAALIPSLRAYPTNPSLALNSDLRVL